METQFPGRLRRALLSAAPRRKPGSTDQLSLALKSGSLPGLDPGITPGSGKGPGAQSI
jgi:hypothetical protein